MNIWYKILNSINGRIKIFLSFAFMCFLSACGECETVQGYLQEGTSYPGEEPDKCFFCPLFETLTNSGADAANTSWTIVASAAQPVVCIVIAIYIAFYTLKMVASMGQQSFADYLTANKKGVLFLSFKAFVIILLLGNGNFLTVKVIAPLLQAAAGVGIELAKGLITMENTDISVPNVADTKDPWNELFGLMNRIARGFNNTVYIIIAIGKALICNAVSSAGIIGKLFPILTWKWIMLIYGLTILLFGWMVCIGVCYFLVDIIINLICGAVLLPLGIAMAISEKTMVHSKNIWNIFVNTFCSCLFLGIVLALAIAVVDVNLGDGTLDALINGNKVSEINKSLKENGSLILMIISLTLLVKIVDSIKDLASNLANINGGLTSAGSKTLTPITQKAKDAGLRLAKSVGKDVGHVASRITHLDELSKISKNKIDNAVGFVLGAGPKGYKAFWRK